MFYFEILRDYLFFYKITLKDFKIIDWIFLRNVRKIRYQATFSVNFSLNFFKRWVIFKSIFVYYEEPKFLIRDIFGALNKQLIG